LYEPVSRQPDPQPFNLIVANPPYVPTAQIEKLDRNIREYEPLGALDGGLDGLVLHRRILEQAAERLVAGGRIYLEIQFDQGPLATEIASTHTELDDVRILKDYGGNDRVLTARKPM
jgi:release factor glutamine methyltransferase